MGRKDRKHQGAGAGRQGGAGAGSRAHVHEGGEEEEEQQLPWQDIGDDEVCANKPSNLTPFHHHYSSLSSYLPLSPLSSLCCTAD